MGLIVNYIDDTYSSSHTFLFQLARMKSVKYCQDGYMLLFPPVSISILRTASLLVQFIDELVCSHLSLLG